jgi:succinylglutamate desuccinylase
LEIGCYNAELKKQAAARRDIEIKCHRLKHRTLGYDFFRIASRGIKRNDRIMLMRAGIHGDEVAGPLTIIQYFNRIFDYAHKRGVKLIIYPLGNPAGVYTLLEFMNQGIVKYLNHFSFLVLPCLNPYGFTRGVRFSGDVSDLNRSFDDVSGPPEVAAVKDLLRRFPGITTIEFSACTFNMVKQVLVFDLDEYRIINRIG